MQYFQAQNNTRTSYYVWHYYNIEVFVETHLCTLYASRLLRVLVGFWATSYSINKPYRG